MQNSTDKGFGILLLDKPEDLTSHSAVSRVRRLFSTREVGHTGTLDPMATGLLVVLVGRAVKASEYFVDGDKRYRAKMRLGLTSDTQDIWGELTDTGAKIPTESGVLACAERFVGDIMQIPPMYSALKRDGQKLVDLARSGVTVEREPRAVRVHSMTAEKLSENEYSLDVCCSKGTYIRTLCADIGEKLGCGAVMSELRRTEACNFSLDDAVTLDALEKLSEDERYARLIPVERAFSHYSSVKLPDFYATLAKSGNEIYLRKIGESLDVGARVLLFDKNGFFAFGEVRAFAEGLAIKPIKQIRLN